MPKEKMENGYGREYQDPRRVDIPTGPKEPAAPPAGRRSAREEELERGRRRGRETETALREKARKSHAGKVFVRVLELVLIAVSFFERSYIVRFLTAKLSMDVLVEITAHFGAAVGHRVSTVLAAIVAEPRLVAVIVTGIILVAEVIVCLFQLLFGRGRRPRRERR